MNKMYSCALALALALAADAVSAQAVSVRGGTTGFGGDIGVALSPLVTARLTGSYGSLSRELEESGVRYDGKIKVKAVGAMLDLHPFDNGFRFTAGVLNNDSRFDATAKPQSGTIEINGVTYAASQVGSLNAQITFDRLSPYLGIGWGKASGAPGFFFVGDLGMAFVKPKGTLSGTCGPALPALACTQLQADILAEAQQYQSDIRDIKYFPVISFGAGYRF